MSSLRVAERLRSERGAAAVEFALVLLPLLLILFGIIEFSRYYNAQQTIQHAAREGVRVYAISRNGPQGTAAASNAVTNLPTPAPGFAPTGGSPCTVGNTVQMTGTYQFHFTVPLIGNIVGNPKTLTARGVMRCGG